MKSKSTKRRLAETAVGVAVGGAVAGPIGALAGGLAAGHVESGLEKLAKLEPSGNSPEECPDDPIVHARLKSILVPVDFSPASRRVLLFAREWAVIFGAKICLVHVIEPTAIAGDLEGLPARPTQAELAERAKAALDLLARTEFPDPINVKRVVRKGKPFRQIVTAARDFRADLIIIGTRGLSGLKHALLGSTAEQVARHASCPVLILRRSQGHSKNYQ